MLSRFKENIAPHIADKKPLIVAVSGGPDSMCLLHLLLKSVPRDHIIVGHFDHMIRKESGQDALFVADYCNRNGIACIIAQADIPLLAKKNKRSLEEMARIERYTFLRQLKHEYHASLVLTAHHRDDTVETILLHLIRGSGLQGFAGLQEKHQDILRPLLGYSKEELLRYCEKHQIPNRLDKTNLKPNTTRNMLRLKILPLLRGLNPNLEETLLRTATQMKDLQEFLATEAGQLRRQKKNILSQAVFKKIPAALQREVLRQLYSAHYGSTDDLTFHTIERARQFVTQAKSGKTIPFGTAAQFTQEHGTVRLVTKKKTADPSPKKALLVPGITRFGPYTITVKRLSALPSKPGVYFSTSKSLWVRTWQQGDRFRPLGMRGDKKLQDFFTDEKIPLSLRASLPLIVDRADKIVCVYNRRIDDRVKVSPGGTDIFSITIRP